MRRCNLDRFFAEEKGSFMLDNQNGFRSLLGLRSSPSVYFETYGDLAMLGFLEYVPSEYTYGCRQSVWDHTVAGCNVRLSFEQGNFSGGTSSVPMASFFCYTHNKQLAILERVCSRSGFSLG